MFKIELPFKVLMKWNFCLLFYSKILKSMILWFVIFEFGLQTSAYKFFSPASKLANSSQNVRHSTHSAFNKTRLPPELRRVLSCKSPAIFLHFLLEEKGPWGPFYQLRRVLAKERHLLQILLKALITRNCFTFRSELSRHPTSGRVFIMNERVNESISQSIFNRSTQGELAMDFIK